MSDTFQPTIVIGEEEFLTALKHGVELWNDGSTPTYRLDQRDGRSGFTRYVNARIEGKLAEEAFSKLLSTYYGIESAVDYDIYGDIEITDDGDLKHIVGDDGETYDLSAKLDVKKTKPYNSWLCIRRSVYDSHPDDAPFVLMKLAIEDDIVLDEWENADSWDEMAEDPMFEARFWSFVDNNLPVEVDVVGTAYPDEFTDEFDEGDRLYDPESGDSIGGPLRRDNMGMPCSELDASKQRWDRVVREITADIPVEWDGLAD